jgi:hypothetical protein
MPNEHAGGFKLNGSAVKMIMAILAIGYILIADIGAPLVKSMATNGGSKMDLVAITQSNLERITRLEVVVVQLVDVPRAVAMQTEAIQTLKAAVDKLADKLDRHISRGPQ